jgi:predicted aldo/keto reductase-like oxidoreductase
MPEKTDIQGLLAASKAEYRNLGKSGLKVSVPILGAMSIGDKKWQPWVVEESEALELLKEAYERGVTSWDTGMYSISFALSDARCIYTYAHC